jgi:hypothetical protein
LKGVLPIIRVPHDVYFCSDLDVHRLVPHHMHTRAVVTENCVVLLYYCAIVVVSSMLLIFVCFRRWDNQDHHLYPKLIEIRSGGSRPSVGEIVCLHTMGPARVTCMGRFQNWLDWISFDFKGSWGAGLFSADNPDPKARGMQGPAIQEEVVKVRGCAPHDFDCGRVWFFSVEFVKHTR